MAKQSAGILVWRRNGDVVEVLLAHAGGPFWARKDDGAWSIPKGETDADEDLLAAAKREFAEEIGQPAPEGEYLALGSFKRSSKEIFAWAVEGSLDVSTIRSNTFEMEWPPHSGQKQQFPEINRAAWFDIQQVAPKLHTGQSVFLERLADILDIELATEAQQQSLL